MVDSHCKSNNLLETNCIFIWLVTHTHTHAVFIESTHWNAASGLGYRFRHKLAYCLVTAGQLFAKLNNLSVNIKALKKQSYFKITLENLLMFWLKRILFHLLQWEVKIRIFFYTAKKWPTHKKKKCMWWAGLIGFHSDLLHGLQVGRHLAERRDSVVALGFYWICSVAGTSVTYLEVGACARLDVVRGEPLPHLNQGQAFFVIHVEHRLVDGGREQRHSHRNIWGGQGGQRGRRVSLIEAT